MLTNLDPLALEVVEADDPLADAQVALHQLHVAVALPGGVDQAGEVLGGGVLLVGVGEDLGVVHLGRPAR
jgi:hypothetical protein